MTPALSPEVRQALADAGHVPGSVLGAGMEGVVVELGDDLVAKTWHARTRGDLDQLREFYAAVRTSGIGLATPTIEQVIDVGDQVVSIERRLHGRPLRKAMDDRTHVVTDAEVSCVLTVLTALRRATPAPEMASLPVLDGEHPFEPDTAFTGNLAALVGRRTRRSHAVLSARVPDLHLVVGAVVTRLRSLDDTPSALLHGDLIPANVLVDDRAVPSALLDFGFFSTVGDPRFDAAVAASVHDMYGDRARENERVLDEAVVAELGDDRDVLAVYRAAYALCTSTSYSPSGSDGHFAWCTAMLERDDVRDALGL